MFLWISLKHIDWSRTTNSLDLGLMSGDKADIQCGIAASVLGTMKLDSDSDELFVRVYFLYLNVCMVHHTWYIKVAILFFRPLLYSLLYSASMCASSFSYGFCRAGFHRLLKKKYKLNLWYTFLYCGTYFWQHIANTAVIMCIACFAPTDKTMRNC